MSKRSPRRERSSGGSPAWMTTYADTVTLLLAFFVLLFAFSTIDIQKFQAIISAFQGTPSVLDGGRTVVPDPSLSTQSNELEMEQLQNLYQQLHEFVAEKDLSGAVRLDLEERGLTIRLADQVFFDLGRAAIKPEAQKILSQLSPLLRNLPNPIRIEGHTDNLPIRTQQFPSNWELSTYRATNVIRYLVEQEGFDPEKLSAAGYGEYRPLKPNTSDANRALNRRVDIVIMRIDLWDEEPS